MEQDSRFRARPHRALYAVPRNEGDVPPRTPRRTSKTRAAGLNTYPTRRQINLHRIPENERVNEVAVRVFRTIGRIIGIVLLAATDRGDLLA